MVDKGRIIKSLAGFYYVDNGKNIYACKARGRFRNRDQKPVVGDLVEFEYDQNNDGYILDMAPRFNNLIRPLVANVDQALIIFACKEPEFSTILLDKFLLIIENKEIKPIIVITKIDLGISNSLKSTLDGYQKSGYEIHLISSHDKIGLENLTGILKDKITVLTGQSGVGKSSLLNALDLNLDLATDGISKALGRGKHTTRHVELMKIKGGYVIDTPGFSSMEVDLSPLEVAHAYQDFKTLSLSCRFRGCLHDSEPGCAVKEAVDKKLIGYDRYANYLTFLNDAKNREAKKYG